MENIYSIRRQKIMENKQGPCMVCIFSGSAPMRSMDEAYPFSVDRNFFYLTGIEKENMILVMRKNLSGDVSESLYIEPFDEVMAGYKRIMDATLGEKAYKIEKIEKLHKLGYLPSQTMRR